MKIPFTPVVYEHAARFVGRSPGEVSRDPDLLFAAHCAAYREYHHQVIAVGIDIYNLEAEAYGAKIEIPEDNAIPGIHQPLLTSLEEGMDLAPFDPVRDGRIAMVIETARRLKCEFPEADVRVPVAGPFSIAFNLRGINRLCEDVILRSAETARFLMRLAENQAVFCRAVAQAGLDVAFFESAAAPPLLSPRHFHEVELPALKRILVLAAEAVGHPVPCIMGGNTHPIVRDILSTGTNYVVCNVETNQAAFVHDVNRSHPHVKIRVNLDPAVVACHEPQLLYQGIDRALEIAGGRPQCVMGTGALPFETPPENIRLIRDYLAG
ncbi:MAG TPA: uroporphyrinogen decarboxylase family protein [Candidatus Paceibacterota bacterium]|nr:uroporphyrinogen decarboxylase family protein [Verrucomicrobiota bacterium]HRY48330.1 uroporphyrinogen decarboxylase family protein [Candidatus Paceibacterota bacterium]HSA03788.1 uroporphyrinogen decarboxylase family protein [Candidatus Paceibacterota bacterium]